MADENVTSVLGERDSLTKDPKPTEDYSKEVDLLFIEIQNLLQNKKIEESVEKLLLLEKKCRQGADSKSSSRLCCKILNIYKEENNYNKINEYIILLCKKRAQLKKSIVDIVQLSMQWIINNQIPDHNQKLHIIQTLSNVTEGKIFVEVERARLIRILAKIKEDEGNIDEAANLLQDVQVETFGAMEKKEKAEYILNQMRTVLKKKDYLRCQIISKKINRKLLETNDMQNIKLLFYNYMIQYYLHENKLLDVCASYFNIFHTKIILADTSKWMHALQCYILYLILSPHEMTQRDMLFRVQEMEKKKIAEMPLFKRLLCEFLKDELMNWPLPYEEEIKKHSVFVDGDEKTNEKLWSTFRKRVLQHNIKVISTYYTRISMKRLASLLCITEQEGETEISELVYTKAIRAKIDRVAGIVCFGERKDTADTLNDWSGDIAKLLDLVEESSHLIQKEKMINAARAKKIEADAKVNG